MRVWGLAGAVLCLLAPDARAEPPSGGQYLNDAQKFFQTGSYFKAARYAFAAKELNPSLEADADAWISSSLVRAGLPNSASYFFVKTLQSGNTGAIRRVLIDTERLLTRVGADLLRKYLVRHTKYEDYDPSSKSAYLYALGKEALLSGDEQRAIGYVNGIHAGSLLWPFALQLRGSAYAVLGNGAKALEDFRSCGDRARGRVPDEGSSDARHWAQAQGEAEDLKARCFAGEARTLYQIESFDEADRVYDRIPKASLVWPDILFEQAWNAFSRQEFNRALGKLVSYKSPALQFVFNTEVDVLRAQSYLALCLYADANDVINEFNAKYSKVGEKVKNFVEGSSNNLAAFYELGKSAYRSSIYSENEVYRMANRFVRGPYFKTLVLSEKDVSSEFAAIQRFDRMQAGVDHKPDKGFPGFLEQVLKWRTRSIQMLGGAYVKNSLMDYHAVLISDFEKMAFIKLEMLKRAKESLLYKNKPEGDRSIGNIKPKRRDYQYYWSFNGEFWNDELGDYVFGLESACRGQDG